MKGVFLGEGRVKFFFDTGEATFFLVRRGSQHVCYFDTACVDFVQRVFLQ